MKQLALDLKLADFAVFETFHAGPNSVAVKALRSAIANNNHEVHWIWGRAGTGRSHLLQALVAEAASGRSRCAWLPLGSDEGLVPEMLEGMGDLDLLCVDDIDAVAGDAAWERALFSTFEALKQRQGSLLVSARTTPGEAGFDLADLRSRLASGPVWKLQRLDDQDLLQAMKLRTSWSGLDLSDEAGAWLLRRVSRETRDLFQRLDQLDHAALAAQRDLTIPFLRSVLEES